MNVFSNADFHLIPPAWISKVVKLGEKESDTTSSRKLIAKLYLNELENQGWSVIPKDPLKLSGGDIATVLLFKYLSDRAWPLVNDFSKLGYELKVGHNVYIEE